MDDNWKWLIVILVVALIIIVAGYSPEKQSPPLLERKVPFNTLHDTLKTIARESKKMTSFTKEEVINTPIGYLVYHEKYTLLSAIRVFDGLNYTITFQNATEDISTKETKEEINQLCLHLMSMSKDGINVTLVDYKNHEKVLYISHNGEKLYYYKDKHE